MEISIRKYAEFGSFTAGILDGLMADDPRVDLQTKKDLALALIIQRGKQDGIF